MRIEPPTHESLKALVAQLHYDRADVARVSLAGAAAMDIAIAEVAAAAEKLGRADDGHRS